MGSARLTRRARWRAFLALGSLALGLGVFGADWLGAPLAADEASGTWTGEVTVQGNYYWETSTRVVAPEVGCGDDARWRGHPRRTTSSTRSPARRSPRA
jgi:hypothetical protein